MTYGEALDQVGFKSLIFYSLTDYLLENFTFKENDIIIMYINYRGLTVKECEKAGIVFYDTTSIFKITT